MYSYEIDSMIKGRNGVLTPEEYLIVTDIRKNPQLSRVKYEPYNDTFFIATNDGFSWTVKVKIQ